MWCKILVELYLCIKLVCSLHRKKMMIKKKTPFAMSPNITYPVTNSKCSLIPWTPALIETNIYTTLSVVLVFLT